MNWIRTGLGRFGTGMALVIALAGCTVTIVSPYDDLIDSNLTQMNTDVTAFVNKMISEASTPAGVYSANKDFYVTEEAKADTIIARAQAHEVLNSCPSTDLITKVITAVAPAANAATYVKQIPQGDCSVALLTLVKQNLVQLETFHQAQGAAGIPASAHDPILVGGLGSLIHSAITVEVAKKTGKSVGGS